MRLGLAELKEGSSTATYHNNTLIIRIKSDRTKDSIVQKQEIVEIQGLVLHVPNLFEKL